MEQGTENLGQASAAALLPAEGRPGPNPLRILRITLLLLLLLRLGSVFVDGGITWVLVNKQDRWLVLLLVALGLLALVPWPRRLDRPLQMSTAMVITLAALLGSLAYWGHYALLAGYDLSRDEQMAVFDATVFASGHLVAPLPVAWQPHASALNLMFMLPVEKPAAWISAYLPGNAFLRTVTGLLGDPALTGPLLAALSVVLTWRCARQLWPDELEPQAIAVLLVALSGQVLTTGMTAYAMTAHLCLNLAWLWLFLRRTPWADALALLVGFAATGLHQPLPHPMFVAPFLALIAVRREWRRLGLYVAGYTMIGLFWLGWPTMIHARVSGPLSTTDVENTGYFGRLATMLAGNAEPLPLMAANLLRFVTWQAVPLIPLLIAGLHAARRDVMAAALAAGVVLTTVVMTAILAYQGHGFGYRYLHGLIGSTALLGGYGWRALVADQARWRPVLRRAFVLTAIVLLPVEAAMAHSAYAPYARTSQRITRSGADYAVVFAEDAPFGSDLAINRPDLANRPIRLRGERIKDPVALAHQLCRPGVRVVFLGPDATASIWAWFGFKPETSKLEGRHAIIRQAFTAASCKVSQI